MFSDDHLWQHCVSAEKVDYVQISSTTVGNYLVLQIDSEVSDDGRRAT